MLKKKIGALLQSETFHKEIFKQTLIIMDITEKFEQVLDNPDSVTPEERRAIIDLYISERESDIAEVKASIAQYKDIAAKLQAMVDQQEAIIAAVKARAPISKVSKSIN